MSNDIFISLHANCPTAVVTEKCQTQYSNRLQNDTQLRVSSSVSIAPSLFVQLLKLTIISRSYWVSVSVHVEVFAKLMIILKR
jgi:hypothetical protein